MNTPTNPCPCPGWAVFETSAEGAPLVIQRCDDCGIYTDDEAQQVALAYLRDVEFVRRNNLWAQWLADAASVVPRATQEGTE
jgi:hypothetical protein